MKPAVCPACNRGPLTAPHGAGHSGWIEFADHAALPAGVIGHPPGFEWFCAAHWAAAQALAGMDAPGALAQLRKDFGDAPVSVPAPAQSGRDGPLARLRHRLRRLFGR